MFSCNNASTLALPLCTNDHNEQAAPASKYLICYSGSLASADPELSFVSGCQKNVTKQRYSGQEFHTKYTLLALS